MQIPYPSHKETALQHKVSVFVSLLVEELTRSTPFVFHGTSGCMVNGYGSILIIMCDTAQLKGTGNPKECSL